MSPKEVWQLEGAVGPSIARPRPSLVEKPKMQPRAVNPPQTAALEAGLRNISGMG